MNTWLPFCLMARKPFFFNKEISSYRLGMGLGSYRDFLNTDKVGLGRFPPIHFETELNCLFCPLQECVKRLCLRVATCKLRDFRNKISLFVLFYNYGKFFFHYSFTSLFLNYN